jgi:restriction system protein
MASLNLMAADTLYDLLGVQPDATTDEIRAAYRRLSKTYHPDKGGTPAFFRQLQHAHETLSDPTRRKAYDQSLDNLTGSQSNRSGEATEPPPGSTRFRDDPHEEWGPPPDPGARSTRTPSPDRSGQPFTVHRMLSSWSRGINSLAFLLGGRGRRRQDVVVTAWVTTVIVALVFVVVFLQATHGFTLLILLAVAFFVIRHSHSRKQEAQAVAAKEEAARARAAAERAERERAAAQAAAGRRERASQEEARRQRARQAAEAERERAAARAAAEEQERAFEEDARQGRQAREDAESGDLDAILGLTPKQFEYTMAALLRLLGCVDVSTVGGRGDLGVDITARDSVGRTMVVQCKRYARHNKIGSPDIQRFIGMAHVHHQADLMLFVTTSDFTSDARGLAARHNIQLMNGSDIVALARKTNTNRSDQSPSE